jgi:glutaconate CoA-transferase subunit B
MTPHQLRRFPEKVDFLTSAGYLDGRQSRDNLKLRGKGPVAVVTDIGILEPDSSGELILTALHPGRTAEDAIANTGWKLKVSESLRETEELKTSELKILREDLDPSGTYTKGG